MRQYSDLPGQPAEWLVYDEPAQCPYLPGRRAHLPMRLPVRPLTRREMSERLYAGDRRQGMLLYRPACSGCDACKAIRIDVNEFRPGRTQARVLRRGNAGIEVRVGRPTVTPEKVALYNRHKVERNLVVGGDLLGLDTYEQFLVDTCADTIELEYRAAGRLIAVAIADRGLDSLSAVYCFFDPQAGRWSPGTYSILKMIELCRRGGLRYLYLGLYVEGAPPMAYKAAFLPHERLIDRRWQRFDRETAAEPPPVGETDRQRRAALPAAGDRLSEQPLPAARAADTGKG